MLLVKRIFLIFILFFLSSFYIQKKLSVFSFRPLDGIKDLAHEPRLNVKGVFDLSYQDSLNKYEGENMGFRPFLMRFYSQLSFSLFTTTKAPGVVVGKDGHLFIESYINNYIGANFVGKTRADENVSKIKAVQEALKKTGTDLIIIFAPGKASYYSFNIPDNYFFRGNDTTNYSYYSKMFLEKGVNFIDFNSYFIENKNSFVYPVYPEYGTHWTSYASALTMDSIIHYIERKRNIDLPGFDYGTIKMQDSLREREYDIGILLNLPKMLPHKPMPYPVFKYNYSKEQVKPEVLVVGDSYWWCMVGDDIPYHVFKNDEYWFYNKDIYKRNAKQDIGVAGIPFANNTVNRDVIIIMATEATFDLFPYGFIDKAFEVYCLDEKQKKELIAKKINADEGWKKNISKKAQENKISEKEQLEKDVQYVLVSEYTPVKESNTASNEIIKEIEGKIKKDGTWMEQIKKKALENQIPTEVQLNQDARFIYESEYGKPEIKTILQNIRKRISDDSTWMAQIKTKAAAKGITTEEMLELDTKYIYDTEVKDKK